MAKNSSSLKGKAAVLYFDELIGEKLSNAQDWITLSQDCDLQHIHKVAEDSLAAYEVIFLIGGGQDNTLPRIPKHLESPLWNFVENGGLLYGEMLDTSEYTPSRLFGFKQDFAQAQEYLKKLRVNTPLKGLEVGTLLQWNGQFIPGFAIDSSVLLKKGEFRDTHFSKEEGGIPALVRRELGQGVAYYSAIPLLASVKQWMYRPYGAWTILLKSLQEQGLPLVIREPPIQIPAKSPTDSEVLEQGFKWFLDSGILPELDGTKGIHENIHSHHGGLTKDFRPDCHVQTALSFYLYGEYTQNQEWIQRSFNLLDFIIKEGFQDEDEDSCSYGFWKWFDYPGSYPHQIFTDDNSWIATVLLYLGRQTENEDYLKRGLLTAEALLRTQGKNGLRTEQLIRHRLQNEPNYLNEVEVSFNPHFESICHVAFLQAYLVSDKREFLDTALQGMTTLRENKEKWKWMYSHTAALARYLFPLALILQIVEEKATWEEEFYWTIAELKKHQVALGAIVEADNPDPERFGAEDTGVFIHDGEGIADLLYTNNFLLLHLWEGWKGTKDPEILGFYEHLRTFLCSTQIRSSSTNFNGAWMRAFDVNALEYYGNLGDTGWGPYCIESGWTQATILTGLLAQELNLSLIK